MCTWGVFLRVGVYNGGKLLHSVLETPVQTCDEACNPQWCTWLQTDLPVCHTPRAARICFTLYARMLGKKDGGDTPLAWVSMQLFNHKDQLVRPERLTPKSPPRRPPSRPPPLVECPACLQLRMPSHSPPPFRR